MRDLQGQSIEVYWQQNSHDWCYYLHGEECDKNNTEWRYRQRNKLPLRQRTSGNASIYRKWLEQDPINSGGDDSLTQGT